MWPNPEEPHLLKKYLKENFIFLSSVGILLNWIITKICIKFSFEISRNIYFYANFVASYGAHLLSTPFNKLIHLANQINPLSVFNKTTLWFII